MARFKSGSIAAARKHEPTMIDRLRDQRALQRATAQPLPDLSSWQRRRVDRLVERGVIRQAAKDRYYLDEDALADWRSRQFAAAFAVAVFAAGVSATWLLAQ